MKEYIEYFKNYSANVYTWGDIEKPQIICFHGLGSTGLSFIEIAEYLKDTYYIVSIDLPGHGKSPAFELEAEYEAIHLIKWVELLLEKIGKEHFYVLAHSLGASIALHYAEKHSEKVEKMMLLDGGYHHFEMENAYFKKKFQNLDKPDYISTCLEEDLNYYEKDFEEYEFENEKECMAFEKTNYTRWSNELEKAVKDLMRIENGRIRYHANGKTARAYVKFQYLVYRTVTFEKIESQIMLLYSDLPEYLMEIKEQMIAVFLTKKKNFY